MSDIKPKISIDLIQKLRTRTGVGMMDCRKALEDANGDVEEAVCLLRKKGLSVATKRGELPTDNGLVEGVVLENKGVLVQVSCETDFSARTEHMKKFAKMVATTLVSSKNMDACSQNLDAVLDEKSPDSGLTIKSQLEELMSKICENIKISKVVCFNLSKTGVINTYVHPDNSVATMIELACGQACTDSNLLSLAKDLCMQIAVTKPIALEPKDVPADILEREKSIAKELAEKSGKPENFWDKIVDGKINKFYEEACFYNQKFIKDDSKTIKAYLTQKAKELSCESLEVVRFARLGIKR